MKDVIKTVEDGTEFREVTLRVRESGVKEILTGLGNGGFCNAGSGRVMRLDGEIFFEFCFNVGTYQTRVKAMGLAISIPLTPEENDFKPSTEVQEGSEIQDETNHTE